ncbi:hypothetical protein [Xylophilus ampelinus]|nr:hypothetical protein [Xylophilus ampelinus]MCS4510442.1 hypothetical protein [Xylophilus ampelinus]
MVVDHANHCSYCDNEVAWQQKIHRGMQDTPPAIDSAALDAGLERLWARDRDVDATQLPAPRGVIGNEEVNAVMASVVAGRSKNKRWLLMALTVQAMATLVLGLQLAWDPKSDDIDPIPSAGLPQAILRMVPHGRTDMNTLRHLLNQHGLRIVGADEEANSLLLAPLGPEPIPASSAVALLENLRDEPGVMLVVPVVPQVNR